MTFIHLEISKYKLVIKMNDAKSHRARTFILTMKFRRPNVPYYVTLKITTITIFFLLIFNYISLEALL